MAINVYDDDGDRLGSIPSKIYRKTNWAPGFISRQGKNKIVVHFKHSSLPKPNGLPGEAVDYLRRLNSLYAKDRGSRQRRRAKDERASSQSAAKAEAGKREPNVGNASKSTPDTGPTWEDERRIRRMRLVVKFLEGRTDECRDAVIRQISVMSEEEIDGLIAQEVKRHPSRYAGIEPHEKTRLMAIALANMHDLGDDGFDAEYLLERAHLFHFDQKAESAALAWEGDLDRLPYPICLVEDVILYELDGEIRALAVSDEANPDISRRMMSFVTNSCQAYEDEHTIHYRKALPPLEGQIDVGAVSARGPSIVADKGSDNDGERPRDTHAGRSPRVHTRRGHWRNQAYGPRQSLRKRIWISNTIVTPSGKPYRIGDATRVHMVTTG